MGSRRLRSRGGRDLARLLRQHSAIFQTEFDSETTLVAFGGWLPHQSQDEREGGADAIDQVAPSRRLRGPCVHRVRQDDLDALLEVDRFAMPTRHSRVSMRCHDRGVETSVVQTSIGPVEVALNGPIGAVVLVFPGGHTTAASPLGTDLYTDLGYQVLTVSRPGYGRTDVGLLMAAEFVPAVADVCEQLGITETAATAGVSFGGLQAVQVAVSLPHLAPRLVLHSCAPSTLPYPDTALEGAAGPLAFAPWTQRLTWRAVRALTSSDKGLRLMMSSLSTAPSASWWETWTPADRASARETFAAMDSGSGFVTDLRQGEATRSRYREAVLRSVSCPTLVTASRQDGGVSFDHAEDFVRTIPKARLVETNAQSHFYWLGPDRPALSTAIHDFMSE